MDIEKDGFYLTTDQNKFDFEAIHQFIKNSYWAQNIPSELLQRAIENSVAISLFDTSTNKQIGFARCITDQATFAYLGDVYVLDEYRGKGLATWMLESLFSLDCLQGLRRISLVTKDANKLYEKLGFINQQDDSGYMDKRLINPYL